MYVHKNAAALPSSSYFMMIVMAHKNQLLFMWHAITLNLKINLIQLILDDSTV